MIQSWCWQVDRGNPSVLFWIYQNYPRLRLYLLLPWHALQWFIAHNRSGCQYPSQWTCTAKLHTTAPIFCALVPLFRLLSSYYSLRSFCKGLSWDWSTHFDWRSCEGTQSKSCIFCWLNLRSHQLAACLTSLWLHSRLPPPVERWRVDVTWTFSRVASGTLPKLNLSGVL